MGFRHLGMRAGLVTGAAVLLVAGLTGIASASASPKPASGTPQLYPNGTVEQVRQPLPLTFRSSETWCPVFRGWVTVWRRVGHGGVMGCGGP
jgi:hypothetical protein